EARHRAQPRLAPRVRRVRVAVEHEALPAARPGARAEDVRAAVIHLLPLHVQAHRVERLRHQLGHSLLVAGEAVHADHPRGGVDETVAIDLHPHAVYCGRTCGSTFDPNRRICSCRFAPQSSSITWLHPASRYSSIAAMQSAGVPAIGRHLSSSASETFAFAAKRPPCSIASATGRISPCSMPARSRSVSAAPWLFCTLFARYIPAISRAPSRPASRSVSWMEATTVQPTSMPAPTFSRVYRTKAGVVIDGVRQPSPISPASCCIFGAVAATYTGGTSRGACASARSAGTFAFHVEPSYANSSPPRTPRTISTASRIGPSVFDVCIP